MMRSLRLASSRVAPGVRAVSRGLGRASARAGGSLAATRGRWLSCTSARFSAPAADSDAAESVEDGEGRSGEGRAPHEIKDPELIFNQVWKQIESQHGRMNLTFPKEVLWLAGAPGSGKGTMCKHIMRERGITAPPIETSALLDSEEARRLKEKGVLLGDREVVSAVFSRLLSPEFDSGIVVDGFPRTVVQAECIWLLYSKMLELRQEYEHRPELLERFRRPIFRIAVLYVDESTSVERQLHRGQIVNAENERNVVMGVGDPVPVRPTDQDAALAKKRYRLFKEEVYGALKRVKDRFHFHFIDADASPEVVRERIEREFAYQSSLELDDSTFEAVRQFPLASEITVHARQGLVQRLDRYNRERKAELRSVMELLQTDFRHILKRQALAGSAIIRSQSSLFDHPVAVDMVLDVLSERGFTVTLDVVRERIPDRIVERVGLDGDKVHAIECRMEKYYVFHVTFPRPQIRRQSVE